MSNLVLKSPSKGCLFQSSSELNDCMILKGDVGLSFWRFSSLKWRDDAKIWRLFSSLRLWGGSSSKLWFQVDLNPRIVTTQQQPFFLLEKLRTHLMSRQSAAPVRGKWAGKKTGLLLNLGQKNELLPGPYACSQLRSGSEAVVVNRSCTFSSAIWKEGRKHTFYCSFSDSMMPD